MRILGLDIGDKRIGVAISDETETIASAMEVINVDGSEFERIGEIINQHGISEVAVGLPLNMNGSKGPAAIKASDFADKIKNRFKVSVSTFDERLTTKQGEAFLISADMSRKKRKAKIDKIAAQIMLQAYIDSRKERKV